MLVQLVFIAEKIKSFFWLKVNLNLDVWEQTLGQIHQIYVYTSELGYKWKQTYLVLLSKPKKIVKLSVCCTFFVFKDLREDSWRTEIGYKVASFLGLNFCLVRLVQVTNHHHQLWLVKLNVGPPHHRRLPLFLVFWWVTSTSRISAWLTI